MSTCDDDAEMCVERQGDAVVDSARKLCAESGGVWRKLWKQAPLVFACLCYDTFLAALPRAVHLGLQILELV